MSQAGLDSREDMLRESRILVCAPTGNDARLTVEFLAKAGFGAIVCRDPGEVATEFERGCGAVILAEETLSAPSLPRLVELLGRQPAWSDLPITLITSGGAASEARLRTLTAFGAEGNVALLERPFRPGTLVSSVEVALRTRRRQYEVRKLLWEVQESESRFRLMSDAAPVLIWTADQAKRHTWVNREWLRFTGRALADELGQPQSGGKVHPDDLLQYALAYKLSAEERQPFEVVYRLRRHDGSWRWILERGSPFFERAGEFTGYIGSCIDISDIQHAQLALGTNARRSGLMSEIAAQLLLSETPSDALASIFDRVAEELGATFYFNYFLAASRDKLVLANAGGLTDDQRTGFAELQLGEALCGLAAQRQAPVVLGTIQQSTFGPALAVRALGARAYACQPLLVGGRLLGTLSFAASSRDEFSSDELRFIATVADLVSASIERNRLLAELRDARDAAEKASRAKDDFLAALSHELRTPLNPVLLLATEAAANPLLAPEVRSDFEQISKGVTLEARLIDDLLDLTRITRGKTSLAMEPVDVHSVLKDALVTAQADIEQKRLVVTLDLQADQVVAMADAVRLQQVFWNVLKNAAKFTPHGGSIAISSASDKKRGNLMVTVRDSGVGMTSAELGRVFQAFTQGDHASVNGSHRFGGLGLGLAISKMLIELHQGSIEATSPGPNLGSTFLVRLPLADRDAPVPYRLVLPPPRAEAGKVAEARGQSAGRLLLVEDHEPTRASLALLLSRRGYEVTAAGSVAEAKAKAQGQSFDLVLSDIGLPDGSGYELMQSLRERATTRGIALSGYGMETDIEESRRAGFSAHLVKPINIQSLDAALAEVGASRKAQLDGTG